MDLEKLLEVIHVQRHDFLNHLQVISGLMQLNKVERAREYIGQVGKEMEQTSKTARVKIPEVTAALLIGLNEAAKYQIKVELSVNSNFADCAIAGHTAGEAVQRCLDCIFLTMATPEIKERYIEIYLMGSEKKYTCRILFPNPKMPDTSSFENGISALGALLSEHKGRVNLAVANDNMEIYLTLPRKEKKSGYTTSR